MELQTIKQVSKSYGISARMLRYYEQVGLIRSSRRDDYAYRVYDETAIKQLQQIIILRKLRIPMKQISVILNNPYTAQTVDIFMQNIKELDGEINALTTIREALIYLSGQLKNCENYHMNTDMFTDSSILSIVQTLSLSKNLVKETVTVADFKNSEERVNKLTDVRVIYLPPMTVAASHATGENCEAAANDVLNNFISESGLLKSKPDVRHFGFDCSNGQSGVGGASLGYEMWVSIPDDMEVPAPLIKRTFHGGFYAAHMIKMGGWDDWRLLKNWVMENGKYVHDWGVARWSPYEEGMEHCLEEQLNFVGNMQNPNVDTSEIQLDLLFPIKENV